MKKGILLLLVGALLMGTAGCSAIQGLLPSREEIRKVEIPFTTEKETVPEEPETKADDLLTAGIRLLEKDGLRITLDTYRENGDGPGNAPVFYLTVENGTERDLRLTAPFLVLNGIQMANTFTAEAASGDTVQAEMAVEEACYDEFYPLPSLNTYLAEFRAEDAQSGGEWFQEETETVTLPGSTEIPYMVDFGGLVLYMGDGLVACIHAFKRDEKLPGYDVDLAVTNSTDRYTVLRIAEVLINGESFFPDGREVVVRPGAKTFSRFYVSRTELKEAGVTDPEEGGFAFTILSRETRDGREKEILRDRMQDMLNTWDNPGEDKQREYAYKLLNHNGVEIAVDYIRKDFDGAEYYLPLLVKNRSGKTIRGGIAEVYVNGCLTGIGPVEIRAEDGKTETGAICFSRKDFEEYGITKALSLYVRAVYEEEGTKNLVYGEYLTVPVGNGDAPYKPVEEGESLWETEDAAVRLVRAAVIEPEEGSGRPRRVEYTLFLENKSDKPVILCNVPGYLENGEEKTRELFRVWLPAGGAAFTKMEGILLSSEEPAGRTLRLAFRVEDRFEQVIRESEKVEIILK